VGQSPWTSSAILAEHVRQTQQLLGDGNGVLLLDGSDFPKQGTDSVGVKRQWCGEVGKTANCQAGVFLGYSSRHGYTLLNRRLYMPEEWFGDEYAGRRYKTGVPADLTFQTKNQLAWQMIEETHQSDTLELLRNKHLPRGRLTTDNRRRWSVSGRRSSNPCSRLFRTKSTIHPLGHPG
jgi:SRSO17 transposase